MFRACEILIDGAILEVNVILLGMYDVDVILGMNWLSNHRVSIDCFTKKTVFKKSRYLD